MLIFLAESDQNLQMGMQMLLHQETGMHVVGMAIRADGLLVQVEASHAELLILDWYLPGASMPGLFKELRGLSMPPKVIVLSVNPEVKAEAVAAGADAFVGKNTSPDQLLETVRSIKVAANSTV